MTGDVASAPSTCPACAGPLARETALAGRDRLHGLPGVAHVTVCTRCGTGVTTPAIPAAELAGLYPGAYGAHALPPNRILRELATLLAAARHRRAFRRPPLRVLAERPAGRLLDVGSGRGDLAVAAGRLGWTVTGLEPSLVAADEARRRGVATEVGTLESAVDRLRGPYDVVVFQHSLEHVVDPAADLRRAHALLRPGGAILVTVPNFGSSQARRFGSHWFHLDLPRHRSHFTAAGLRALLRRTGFDRVETASSTSADGLPMSVEYRVLGRRAGRSAFRYAEAAVVLALTPVTALAGRLLADGDLLHAVAVRP